MKRIDLAAWTVILALVQAAAPPSVVARPLEAIVARGVLSLCAHPNALPFSSRRGKPRGFQIDLGRALAGALGVGLAVEWVTTRYHPRRVDCDIILDSINDREAQAGRGIRLSRPYQVSGVALALAPGLERVGEFADLTEGERVGVLSGSMASLVLGRQGVAIRPYGFEDDMLAALARGELEAAAVSPAAAGYYNHRHPARPFRIVPAFESEPRLRWTVAVGMRRADRPLAKAVNRALKRLAADGTIRDIYARYGIAYHPPGRPRGR